MTGLELLSAFNKLGLKSLGGVWKILAEIVDQGIQTHKQTDSALIKAKLNAVAAKLGGQERTLDYLVAALTDELEPPLRTAIEELAYAVQHPDDPPLHIKEAIDQFAARFSSLEDFRVWAEHEFGEFSLALRGHETRIKSMELQSQARRIGPAEKQYLRERFPEGFPKEILITAQLGDGEAMGLAVQFYEHLSSRGMKTLPIGETPFKPQDAGQVFVDAADTPARIRVNRKKFR